MPGADVHPDAFAHSSAVLEDGVTIGAHTKVWSSVHMRGPHTFVGRDCIIGEKTYVSYGVKIGDRVKINAFVYICTAVTVENGVMISAGTVFTNDLYPRATTPDLAALLPSDPNGDTRPTLVREGATIGARAVIGCDLTIGRFAMVGMGAVVTRDVADFHLVIGSPARSVGCVCRCGGPFARFPPGDKPTDGEYACPACGRGYYICASVVTESPTGANT